MYQKCKGAIDVLTPFTSMHKEFLNSQEDLTDDVSGHYAEFIESIAKINIYEMGEFNAVLKAFRKDRASILGIAKKVLK